MQKTPYDVIVEILPYITTSDGKLAAKQWYGLDNVTYEELATQLVEALEKAGIVKISQPCEDTGR